MNDLENLKRFLIRSKTIDNNTDEIIDGETINLLINLKKDIENKAIKKKITSLYKMCDEYSQLKKAKLKAKLSEKNKILKDLQDNLIEQIYKFFVDKTEKTETENLKKSIENFYRTIKTLLYGEDSYEIKNKGLDNINSELLELIKKLELNKNNTSKLQSLLNLIMKSINSKFYDDIEVLGKKVQDIQINKSRENLKNLIIEFLKIISFVNMSEIEESSIETFVANIEKDNYDDIASRLSFLLKRINLSDELKIKFNNVMGLIKNKLSEFKKETIENVRKSKITIKDDQFKDCRTKDDWKKAFSKWLDKYEGELKKYAEEIYKVETNNWDWYSVENSCLGEILKNIANILKCTKKPIWEIAFTKNDDNDKIQIVKKSIENLEINDSNKFAIISSICRQSKELKKELKKEEESDLAVIMTYIHNMTKLTEKKREKIDLKENSDLKLWDSNGPKADDIQQQDIGDCYFKAVLKSLVLSYDFRECFVGGVNEDGTIEKESDNNSYNDIEVRLFKVKVTKNEDGDYEVEPNGQQIIGVEPSVFLTEMQKQFAKFYWPYILIKAYTIMRTTKGMIELGKDCDFLDIVWKKNVRKLTGYSTKFITGGRQSLVQCALTGRKAKIIKKNEQISMTFDEINKIISQGGSVTASFRTDALKLEDFDIQTKHAYSVVKASKENDKKYLYLEDPRGNNKFNEAEIKVMYDGTIRMSDDMAQKILGDVEVSE